MIEALLKADRDFFLFLNSLNSSFLNPVMTFISGQFIWVPFILSMFYLCYKKQGRNATFVFILFVALTLIASDVTSSYILKNTFKRLRPCKEAELLKEIVSFGQKCGGKYGFVSSHAANSLAIVLFSIRALNLKWPLALTLILIPVLISFSRIYLGVHYPGDILGGSFIGATYAILFAQIFKEYLRRKTVTAPN